MLSIPPSPRTPHHIPSVIHPLVSLSSLWYLIFFSEYALHPPPLALARRGEAGSRELLSSLGVHGAGGCVGVDQAPRPLPSPPLEHPCPALPCASSRASLCLPPLPTVLPHRPRPACPRAQPPPLPPPPSRFFSRPPTAAHVTKIDLPRPHRSSTTASPTARPKCPVPICPLPALASPSPARPRPSLLARGSSCVRPRPLRPHR